LEFLYPEVVAVVVPIFQKLILFPPDNNILLQKGQVELAITLQTGEMELQVLFRGIQSL
jgi:hypothetical protein